MFELACLAAALGTIGYWLGKLLVAADEAAVEALDAEFLRACGAVVDELTGAGRED